jgi:uncharacterized peroxidase-related enzyme
MPRIATHPSIDASPEAARPLLQAVAKQLGSVPNLFRTVASSPAALEAYLGFGAALGKGRLDLRTRERIALVVAELNGCEYCLSAHSYIAANLVKLEAAEIAAARAGRSTDRMADAALHFAAAVVHAKGHVADADIAAARAAGLDDGMIVEIVAHVAINTFTNYLNEVARTTVDFPAAPARAAA